MKRISMVLSAAVFLALLSAAGGAAQAPDEGAPEESGMWEDGGPGRGRGGGPGMDDEGHDRFAWGKGGMRRGGRSGSRGVGPERNDGMETLEMIKKYDPAFAAKLAELKNSSPNRYRILMRSSGRLAVISRMEKDESLVKDAVRAFSLEYDTKELARRYDKAAEGDRAGIKKELRAKVAELFDLRIKMQGSRIGRMEKDLARLRKNLEGRKAHKEKIVEGRVDQLTGSGFAW